MDSMSKVDTELSLPADQSSLTGVGGSDVSKKDVTVSRSHSDSYRRSKRLPSDEGLRQTASTDELEKLRVSY